jgi:hypothetical protein
MSKTRALIAGGICTVALLAAGALPASAAPTGDTTTTFTLAAGSLAIVVQPTGALTNGGSGATSISGTLGNVTVTDSRGNVLGWTTSAETDGFARTGGGTTSTGVTYNSGTVSSTGIVVATGLGPVALSGDPSPVVTGTVTIGNHTATWNPALTVTLPPSSLAGNYSGVVTTSVA